MSGRRLDLNSSERRGESKYLIIKKYLVKTCRVLNDVVILSSYYVFFILFAFDGNAMAVTPRRNGAA